ncbi:hypothetical protein AGMMS50230_04630 [Spirochaetia bacterium]|nr:hypothetical protein AGMMS50230_04630 [Spirochaetia bacterium]
MLKFDTVSFAYGGETILRDLSFEIKQGEFVALLGENGAGKSTLCKLCNGLLKPASGTVTIDGKDTRKVKTSILARSVGYLFQNPDRQLCQNTVREEISFGLDYALADKGLDKQELEEEKKRRCEEMLDLFNLEAERAPFGLSRGERQQTALASVLARKAPVLILDEPTTGLDYHECMTIMGIIKQYHEEGTTVLMITHDMEVAADFAERALLVNNGGLAGSGTVREVMKNKALLDANSLLPAQIPALAMQLGPGYEKVFTINEMLAAVTAASAGHKGALQ